MKTNELKQLRFGADEQDKLIMYFMSDEQTKQSVNERIEEVYGEEDARLFGRFYAYKTDFQDIYNYFNDMDRVAEVLKELKPFVMDILKPSDEIKQKIAETELKDLVQAYYNNNEPLPKCLVNRAIVNETKLAEKEPLTEEEKNELKAKIEKDIDKYTEHIDLEMWQSRNWKDEVQSRLYEYMEEYCDDEDLEYFSEHPFTKFWVMENSDEFIYCFRENGKNGEIYAINEHGYVTSSDYIKYNDYDPIKTIKSINDEVWEAYDEDAIEEYGEPIEL